MGNASVVASGVKAQGDVAAKELYSLVALGDGGELHSLMKEAMSSKPPDYSKLDHAILSKVKKFLYKDGKAKKLPIADLVKIRNRDRPTNVKVSKERQKNTSDLAMMDMLAQQDEENANKSGNRMFRAQCWDVDQRGTVGETILHLCMLSATQTHFDLAKRLLKHFPDLINDIYLGEEYYGETILHIAIVNEDPAMVKFLLDSGADYNTVRACGNFFCPDDQKPSRTDCLDHEWVSVCEKTDYTGHVYWGEYPLGFAACLGQEECVRLLLAKGADPNVQDTNGNTVMHMLVIHDKKWLPCLTSFIVGPVTGEIVQAFYRRFVFFILYFCMFVTAFALRPGHDLCAYQNDTSQLSGCSQTGTNRTIDPCYLLQPYRHEDIARLVLEVFVLLSTIMYLLLAMKEIHHQGFRVFFKTLKGAPAKALLLLSNVFVVLMLPGRAFCAHEYEDIMGVLAILSTAPYFLFFCRGFRIVGPFVVMIYAMIRGDLLRFFIIYSIFVIGFSQAMYIPFRGGNVVFSSWWDSALGLFSMSVGDFDDLYAHYDELQTPFVQLIKVIFIVYMIMVTLLLVNMLIAMMGHTYELYNNTQKEWFRQWAKIVLMIEQSVTPADRLKNQSKYSQPQMDGKGRVFVVRWHQTEKEKEELMKLRIQNKIMQQKMAQRNNAMRIFNSTRKLKAAAKLLSKTGGDERIKPTELPKVETA